MPFQERSSTGTNGTGALIVFFQKGYRKRCLPILWKKGHQPSPPKAHGGVQTRKRPCLDNQILVKGTEALIFSRIVFGGGGGGGVQSMTSWKREGGPVALIRVWGERHFPMAITSDLKGGNFPYGW